MFLHVFVEGLEYSSVIHKSMTEKLVYHIIVNENPIEK